MNEPSLPEEAIFAQALELRSAAERAAYLDRACGADRHLRAEVEALLRANEQSGDLLDLPEKPVATVAALPLTEGPGTRIGPYKLLQQIGEGGMGTVFMAEQTHPVQRKVALKVIKAGMDSRQVIARFEVERQALALMDHVHIARILDAGATEAGRPYFVMELVHGVPITTYCDDNCLTPRERLELFVPVCQAIQHAHQKGIIHRDIKPSNIMITLYDGTPVPKVIDFGVAKAIEQRLTERTLFTQYGTMVGTFEYMSPEQAGISALSVDTRSDIYALGVLLYELLTGSTPLGHQRIGEADYGEILRMIKEEEPPKPSTRLSNSGERLPTISAQRHMESAKLTKLVRGELDWIVMKCLEKDRTRRYDTVSDLARDVQRYLVDEPVEACPPSAGYRLRKLLRRHRGPVLAAALVLLALLAGLVGTTWGLIRAEQARQAESGQRALAEANERKALEEKRIAEAVRTFLQRDLLRQANPGEQAEAVRRAGGGFETTENPTIKELLDRAAAELMPGKIEVKFPQQWEVQASILQTVGVTYVTIGEFAKAVEFLTRSSDIYRHAFGADYTDTLTTLTNLAEAYLSAGKTAEAIALYEQVRDARGKKLGADHPDTLTILAGLALAYQVAGKTAAAIALFEQVREARVMKLGADHPDTLTTLDNLGRAYLSAGKTAEAIALFEQVRDAGGKQLGADHPLTLLTQMSLAGAYLSAGKTAQAIALFEQVRDAGVKRLGADHPITLFTLLGLAGAYHSAGKRTKAVTLFEQVRDACVKKFGTEHPFTLTSLDNLGGVYLFAGKTVEATALLEQVREARVKKLGADHPHTLFTLDKLAGAYLSAGKTADAIALFEQVRDARVKKLGSDHPDTLTTLARLAGAYQAAGKLEQALPLFQQAAVGIEKRQFIHPQAGQIVCALSDCHEQLKQYDKAQVWRRKWLAVAKERSGPESLPYAIELAGLGWRLLQQKKWLDAEPLLRECLTLREKNEPDAWTTFNARSMLGEALNGQKKRAEAEPLLVQGYEGLSQRAAKIPKEGKHHLTEALDRLVQLYDAWGKPDEATRWRKELERAKADARLP
jgi:serine/threonine protein kinase/tetratricopeptide (TPR) repeat protein